MRSNKADPISTLNPYAAYWKNLPFYPISSFYQKKFGGRVQKIPVTIADDCPNRMGLNGMQTCVFCDAWGSAAYPEQREQNLHAQIEKRLVYLKETYKDEKVLIYFQAYTSTFLGVQKLRENFETALSFPQVQGIVIGTRPDCLSKAVLDLWQEFSRRCFMSVELGVQSFDNEDLKFLRRGHSAEKSIEAINRIKSQVDVDLGIHLIFGLPNETDEKIIETARTISSLPIDNVKLHNLHVLKNTPLEKNYVEGLFQPISLEEYTRKVILFLEHLSPNIAVHRLAALSSRWDELVAPAWTAHKMKNFQFIVDKMKSQNSYQGVSL